MMSSSYMHTKARLRNQTSFFKLFTSATLIKGKKLPHNPIRNRRFWGGIRKMSKPSNNKAMSDRPLENTDEDCLNRKLFTERIFKIIEGTPINTHLRIGINGSWGSGKSTVLNFIKSQCEGKYPIASFNPWHCSKAEKAWENFALSVDLGLTEWKEEKWSDVKRRKMLKTLSDKTKNLAKLFTSEVGEIF